MVCLTFGKKKLHCYVVHQSVRLFTWRGMTQVDFDFSLLLREKMKLTV